MNSNFSEESTISTCLGVIFSTEDDKPKSKQAELDSASLHNECFCESAMTFALEDDQKSEFCSNFLILSNICFCQILSLQTGYNRTPYPLS
ncbi:hypothetical protein WA026_004473 [Henosepilachna vigintioctopunctata]|uniref:Uncharacterized protein n=1 Tax=Henosepilachna vigintioctopunctata TaxID=420089 RepID=A0AAW1V289_9CUCU